MKECPDCGWMNPDSAVRCRECGSLFFDKVGISNGVETADEPESTAFEREFGDSGDGVVMEIDLDVGEVRAPEVNILDDPPLVLDESAGLVCASCLKPAPAKTVRCRFCGGTRLVPPSSIATGRGKPEADQKKRRQSAWDRRPVGQMTYVGFYDLSPYMLMAYAAAGLVQFLLFSWLASAIILEKPGPRGLHPTTYEWQIYLAVCLTIDAFCSGFGAYMLFYLRRIGAISLAVAFAFNIPLLGWLIYYDAFGTLGIWPGAGPYILLALLCALALFDLLRIVKKGELE